MIRVAFVINVSNEWIGGLNYFKNLLFAISVLENRQIQPIIFMGKKVDPKVREQFEQFAPIVETTMFDRKSLPWLVRKLTELIFKIDIFDYVLKNNKIDVLSHAHMPFIKACKTIEWIPDFQHHHLPDMFPPKEIIARDRHFSLIAKSARRLVFSSNDALGDFVSLFPQQATKARLLHFVSQPNKRYFSLQDEDKVRLLQKYKIKQPYFYLPNQFWKHKNHLLAFEAFALLKQSQIPCTLVCTGHMDDNRNRSYMNEILNFIEKNQLKESIILLGIVPYEDVFSLIRFSEVVINPSLFEGWSSTVEECKGVGKMMILSDLNVHIEQFPQALFFEKNSAADLARQIKNVMDNGVVETFSYNLAEQTQNFALNFQNVVLESLNS